VPDDSRQRLAHLVREIDGNATDRLGVEICKTPIQGMEARGATYPGYVEVMTGAVEDERSKPPDIGPRSLGYRLNRHFRQGLEYEVVRLERNSMSAPPKLLQEGCDTRVGCKAEILACQVEP